MKNAFTLLLLTFEMIRGLSQSTLPPGMVYVPKTKLNYDYWEDKPKARTHAAFYASQYVESNYQYQCYLKCLAAWGLDSQLVAAQPDPTVWKLPGLTADEQAILANEYCTSKEFEHYPVVGLNFTQIVSYLEWKTDMLNLALLTQRGLMANAFTSDGIPAKFSTDEYRDTMSVPPAKRLFASYWLPMLQTLMSTLPIAAKRTNQKISTDKQFMAWLETQPAFDFLLYKPTKSGKLSQLQQKLEEMGIRPVADADLKSLKKRKDGVNLPLLTMEQRFSEEVKKQGYVLVTSEKQKNKVAKWPDINGKKLPAILLDPMKVNTATWSIYKGKLISLSIATAQERPLYGFRAVMTKPE